MLEWLILVVIILLTRALHCYICSRADRQTEREEASASPQDRPPVIIRMPTPPPDPETQPSLSQNQKIKKSPPRRRRKLSQATQVCGELDCDFWHDARTEFPADYLCPPEDAREGSNIYPPPLQVLDALVTDCDHHRAAGSGPELLQPTPRRQLEVGCGSASADTG